RIPVGMTAVRKPAVASTFYPASAVELAGLVEILLADATVAVGRPPKALIAPHASYAFSGIVTACAYARARRAKGLVERVVIIGPAHYLAVAGIATSSAEFFTTPIGELTVDRDAVALVEELANVSRDDAAHAPEHSVEVHLPFVIASLGFVPIVPILVGQAR